MAAPKHVYETLIKASPPEVWAAITRPEFTSRYFHHTSFESTLQSGGGYRYVMADGSGAVDGTIEEVDEPRRLVMTWHVLYDVSMAEEPPSRVEWVLRPANDDATVTRLTLRHLDLGLSPLTSDNVALGWIAVLDSMKTLLETGEPLGDLTLEAAPPGGDEAEHRRLAATAHGSVWEILSRDALDDDAVDELLERAYAAAYHWRRAAAPDAIQQARAAWMLARCHTVAGHSELALHHAQRCASLTAGAVGAADFDRAYAHEGVARALALAGRTAEARRERELAAAVPVADAEDLAIIVGDLAAGPWFGIDEDVSVGGR